MFCPPWPILQGVRTADLPPIRGFGSNVHQSLPSTVEQQLHPASTLVTAPFFYTASYHLHTPGTQVLSQCFLNEHMHEHTSERKK
jgi:hypothetical protein